MEPGWWNGVLGAGRPAPESVVAGLMKLIGREMDTQKDEIPTKSGAVLTIVVHSWAIPIVGVLMLTIGLLGGYFGRPFLLSQSSPRASSSQPDAVSATDASDSSQNQPTNPDELMAFVVSQTRHFNGDPNAPVTIIEFSDFQ